MRSLPDASLKKLPRLMLPSALRVTLGVRLTKSAALTTSPLALTLTPFFHQQLVLETSVPVVWSLLVPWKDRLLVKTWVPVSNLMFSSPLLNDVQLVTVMLPGLLLKVMPCFLFPKAIERLMMWLTGMSSPPSLKPLPSLLVVEPPLEVAPLLNEMQFSMVTGLIGPVSVLVKRSQPSSTLWCAMQPLKTLPGPVVSLQAKPSASSPLSGSKLSKESQLRIRLLAGHSLCGALDEWRPSCSPESRLV